MCWLDNARLVPTPATPVCHQSWLPNGWSNGQYLLHLTPALSACGERNTLALRHVTRPITGDLIGSKPRGGAMPRPQRIWLAQFGLNGRLQARGETVHCMGSTEAHSKENSPDANAGASEIIGQSIRLIRHTMLAQRSVVSPLPPGLCRSVIHATHATTGHGGRRRLLLWCFGYHRLGSDKQARNRGRILQRRADHLGRVDDPL